MPYPTKYTRQYDFQSYQNSNPTRPLPGDKVNVDLNAVRNSVAEIVEFLKTSIRSDGALANGSVGVNQLNPNLQVGFTLPTTWESGVDYTEDSTVFYGNKFWQCNTAHRSTDGFDESKWDEIVDFGEQATAAASSAAAALASQNAASASATTASSAATSASGFATTASNAATTATNAASAASTSATNAGNSATSASGSATDAAASAAAVAASRVFETKADAAASAPVAAPSIVNINYFDSNHVAASGGMYVRNGGTTGLLVITDGTGPKGYDLVGPKKFISQFGARNGIDISGYTQDAIDNVNALGGGVVQLLDGINLGSNSIRLKSGVVLVGNGYNSILKLANGASGSLTPNGDGILQFLYSSGATGCGVQDLVIDGNYANNTDLLRGISFETSSDVFARQVSLKNVKGAALNAAAVVDLEFASIKIKDIAGSYPLANPGEGIYMRDVTDALVRGIRGLDIDDHLIYIDGGAGDGTDTVAVSDAIGRNCGRVSQSSAFNVFQNSKKVTFSDCHSTGSGIGFTCISNLAGTLYPQDVEWNGCTAYEGDATATVLVPAPEAHGWSINGNASRVNGRYRLNNCKAHKSGMGAAVVGSGFRVDGVDDIELNNCTASENNDNGFDLTNVTNFKITGRAINNSRRSSSAFSGVCIGSGSAPGDCSSGVVDVLATDTASSGKKQGRGVYVRGTSSNIDVRGKLSGNASGTLLKDAGVTTTHWDGVVDQGTGANGTYIRYANGVQECWIDIDATAQVWSTALGAFFTPTAAQTWTYPVAFSANPVVTGNVRRPAGEVSGVQVHTLGSTTMSYFPHSSTNLNGASVKAVTLRAVGRWY